MLTHLAICNDSKLEPLFSKLLPLYIPSLSLNSAAVCNKELEYKRENSFSIEFMDLQSKEVILINFFTVELIRVKGGKITREPGPVKGGSLVIAFIEDPDGYKFELLERGPTPKLLCQVMLRVSDLKRSIEFYEKAFGMELLRTRDNPKYKMELYCKGRISSSLHRNQSFEKHDDGCVEEVNDVNNNNNHNQNYHPSSQFIRKEFDSLWIQ
ncbi:hypothetical protein Ahy_A10g050173 isoform A [Arachis hypogaea]|uniref:VOC domain-containing protein n=1 Tax=Arachis hypogaea TaxID=3818 RepID=A0A445B8R4_ARAHY|nr:hypothetical protein Ahy_A10g050173 isoform A [Arachis hypogaea]